MGYTTHFDGAVKLTPPLTADQATTLQQFSETRHSPDRMPGYWCQWVPTEDGTAIMWDGGEKFYAYAEWMQHLIRWYLQPWGITANGEILWEGEERSDFGKLVVTNNKVTTKRGHVIYPE